MKTWLNGRAVDGLVDIDPTDRGLTLGDGVFETILVRDGAPVWFEAHLARMERAAEAMGIAFTRQQVPALPPNPGAGDEVFRLTLTRGPGGRGLALDGAAPNLIATLTPLAAGFRFAPVTLATAETRRNRQSPATRYKTLSYGDNIFAAREAAAAGADEALMLNTAGRASCAATGNLFAVAGGRVLTPPDCDGVLPGIARGHLLASGLAVEGPLLTEDLERAEALFVTNSLRLARPVTRLDGRSYESGSHPRVRAVMAYLEKALDA